MQKSLKETAEQYVREGKHKQAIEAFQTLKADYPGTYFARIADERLPVLQKETQ